MSDAHIFAFGDTTYIDTLWFAAWTNTDWMAVVYRDGDGPWCTTYRFRYYHDPHEAFNSGDDKHAYDMTGPDGTEATRAKFESVLDLQADAMRRMAGAERWKLTIHGDTNALMAQLTKQPWAHIKVMPHDSGAIQ